MSRSTLRTIAVAAIFLLLGVAGTAGVVAAIPDPGSPPSIYDDFQWSSISNGFWHVNTYGSTARIERSRLILSGHRMELDKRVQTDPYETVIAARVRGVSLYKFSIGLGVYHSGTVSMELDNDGIKCGYGSD